MPDRLSDDDLRYLATQTRGILNLPAQTLQKLIAELAERRAEDVTEYGISVPALGDKPGYDVFPTIDEARVAAENAEPRWTHGNPVVIHKRRKAGDWTLVE